MPENNITFLHIAEFCYVYTDKDDLYHHTTSKETQYITVHRTEEVMIRQRLEDTKQECQCHKFLPYGKITFDIIDIKDVTHSERLGPFPQGTLHLLHLVVQKHSYNANPQMTLWTEYEYIRHEALNNRSNV
jgi:hypothetical protein